MHTTSKAHANIPNYALAQIQIIIGKSKQQFVCATCIAHHKWNMRNVQNATGVDQSVFYCNKIGDTIALAHKFYEQAFEVLKHFARAAQHA